MQPSFSFDQVDGAHCNGAVYFASHQMRLGDCDGQQLLSEPHCAHNRLFKLSVLSLPPKFILIHHSPNCRVILSAYRLIRSSTRLMTARQPLKRRLSLRIFVFPFDSPFGHLAPRP